MAETPTGGGTFVFNPNTITEADYNTIKAEREEMLQKQQTANNEFMYQHYARLLRVVDKSYEKATKANVVLERKARREEMKKRRDQLKASSDH